MKKQTVFALLVVLALALSSCGTPPPAAPTTPTLLLTQQTVIPTNIIYPTFTPAPVATAISYPTLTPLPTEIPYPTASVVKSNAVAFISRDNGNSLDTSLWVANVDGSGERKLVDIAYNRQDGDWGIVYYYYLQWSPDGNWISYIESHALWIITPDGVIKRRLFSLPDTRGTFLYRWSPDSSKIAYLEFSPYKSPVTPTSGPDMGLAPYLVGMIDIMTGNVSELPLFEANAGIPVLSWSPDGRGLLFIKDYSLVLFDVAANKIVKTIKRGCGLERGLSWSPNGKWFLYTDSGVGGFNPTWICVNSATGDSIHEIYVDSTSFNPVWDKTGNYVYFLASKIDLTRKSNPLIDERLMRYDARTQKTKSLLSLKELQQPNSYIQYLSISPDGNTLMLQSESSQTKLDLIFVDIQSLTITKSSVDFGPVPVDSYPHINTCGWTSDSKNIIFFFTKLYWINQTIGVFDYGYFYALDISTGKSTVFSGIHSAGNVQVSPAATTP